VGFFVVDVSREPEYTRAMNGRKNTTKGKRGSSHAPPINAWKPGQTGNPHGAPRKNMSTAETIRTLKALTPEELRYALRAGGGTGKSGMEKALASMPPGVPLGLLLHGSAIVSGVCEPSPGVLTYLRDSDEGKPVERQEVTGAKGGPVHLKVTYVNKRQGAASEQPPAGSIPP
jgi:hypothetical protein